jgi:hypothetical protein
LKQPIEGVFLYKVFAGKRRKPFKEEGNFLFFGTKKYQKTGKNPVPERFRRESEPFEPFKGKLCSFFS